MGDFIKVTALSDGLLVTDERHHIIDVGVVLSWSEANELQKDLHEALTRVGELRP